MMTKTNFYIKLILIACNVCFIELPVKAQITSDNSVNTFVIPDQIVQDTPSSLITGGLTKGTTLFHSFKEFNVAPGQGAYFIGPDGVANILSRVTGNNFSNIQGKLGVVGSANLFFLNPNGIFFGQGASLDLSGSFLATTANRFKMSDETFFSADDPQSVPLLTISVPVGLIFTSHPSSITVQGTGHTLSTSGINSAIYSGAGASTIGLRIQPDKTIALVGGDVNFEGGIVSAPSGQINIGSVEIGEVKIEETPNQNFALKYSTVKGFQNIQLNNLSLLDTSGVQAGDINLQGKKIDVSNGSYALNQNQGIQRPGKIEVTATDLIQLTNPDINYDLKSPITSAQTRSGFITQTFSGKGADIFITTQNLVINSGGGVSTITLGSGDTGEISINASGDIELNGYSSLDPISSLSSISSLSYGTGDAKNIVVSANNLFIGNGSAISSLSWNSGFSGSIFVDTKQSVTVKGFNPISLVQSSLISGAFGEGNAQDIIVDTRNLNVLDNGVISSLTLSNGDAGSIIIKAEQVKVDGFAYGSVGFSEITSSARKLAPEIQNLLGTPPVPSGNAGKVDIDTGTLQVSNGGQISVRNEGTGDAGVLRIDANSISLVNQSAITASTQSGQGGSIEINSDLLLMRHNSQLSTSAGNAQLGGDGGQININASFIVAFPLENSDITADAFSGRGGNIKIAAQGVFGIESRPRLTPLSDITASSALGINGTVQIDTLSPQPVDTIILPNQITQTPEIVSTCQTNSNEGKSKFVTSGTGGIPPSPDDFLSRDSGWSDNSNVPQNKNSLTESLPAAPKQIVEAQGWRQTSDGTIILTAEPIGVSPNSSQATLGCKQPSS